MLSYFLIFLQFILLLIAIGIVIYMGLVMASFKNPVPYVPTPRKIIRKMIEKANIQAGEKVVDLGSGAGRVVFAVAKRYPVKIVGIEKSRFLYFLSKLRSIFRKKKGEVKFIKSDFQNYPLGDVNVVLCFITPEGLKIIQDKLAQELLKGARIVSYLFPLEKKERFQESKVLVKGGKNKSYLFVYNKL